MQWLLPKKHIKCPEDFSEKFFPLGSKIFIVFWILNKSFSIGGSTSQCEYFKRKALFWQFSKMLLEIRAKSLWSVLSKLFFNSSEKS